MTLRRRATGLHQSGGGGGSSIALKVLVVVQRASVCGDVGLSGADAPRSVGSVLAGGVRQRSSTEEPALTNQTPPAPQK